MKIQVFTLLFLVIGISIACGGSSGGGGIVTIDGSLGRAVSLPASRDFSADGAEAVGGVEVCCSEVCATTSETGSFSMNFSLPSDGVFCTLEGGDFTNESFEIPDILSPGTYFVQVTAFDESDGGFGYELEVEKGTPECGNGLAEGGNGEDCDGSDLAGGDCFSAGFSTGTLSCNADCTYNTSMCVRNDSPICGDGVIEGGEECDGENIPRSCLDLGFGSGETKCNPDCLIDTSECSDELPTPVCGNNVAEVGGGEDCDGEDLRGETCSSIGEGSGTLKCQQDCSYDVSGCSGTDSSCSESELICSNTGQAPACTSCQCDDGFIIGDCNSICADTMQPPSICSGELACSDSSDPVCPN